MIRRFLAERRILSRLEHPNIPRFLDGGLTTDGAPYFAMEYVSGRPLTTYSNERRLPVRRRIELFAAVCDAVQYAHSHLVVHRDLKPSNILVTPDGVVKVLDFGIAKLLDTEREGETGGGRWMTLDYASPEQIRGDAVTTAADVFALGVVLYELLAGRRPHEASGRHALEVEILEAEVVRPSAVSHASDRGDIVGDLDMITLKSLNEAPERRYRTAGDLAEDLRRHLDGLPVQARPDTFGYRSRKFVARHRRLVAALALAVVSMVVGGLMTIVAMQRARSSALRAALEQDRAEQVSRFAVGLFTQADPLASASGEVTARALLDSGAARLRRELADQPDRRARLLEVLAQSYDGLGQ
jgi:serine/threonine-protein kinase